MRNKRSTRRSNDVVIPHTVAGWLALSDAALVGATISLGRGAAKSGPTALRLRPTRINGV